MKRLFTVIVIAVLAATTILSSCKKKTEEPETSVNPNATVFIENGSTVTVKDLGEGTGNKTFNSDKTWILDGLVFVNEGQTLTIEAGTIIKGKPGEGVDASALIVARGGKINAIGTATNPIIFTAESDDLTSVNTTTGEWGGLIILGEARLNTTPNIQQIEGIDTSEPRGEFGGENDTDNSGILKYISIRHGGTNIGADNEINGLTLGGVGSETTIEYIEVAYNKDDGIEFFGGTAQIKYALVANCEDDSYDYDMGYRGKGQFWVSIQAATSDRNGEHDGGTTPETAQPYAIPEIYNATYIGNNAGSSKTITFRDNAGGHYINSIFANITSGIDIEKLDASEDSYDRFKASELKVENNIFSNVAGQTDFSNPTELLKIKDGDTADSTAIADYFKLHNEVINLGLTQTNPVPVTAQTTNMALYPNLFFDIVSYKGAFGSTNWASGWTLTYKN